MQMKTDILERKEDYSEKFYEGTSFHEFSYWVQVGKAMNYTAFTLVSTFIFRQQILK